MADETILPYMVKNKVVVSAGGMDIKVEGNTLTFTIANNNWQMSVGECEAMLESHQLLIDSCKQIVNSTAISIGHVTKKPVIVNDDFELYNGIIKASAALRRADIV